ncbi:putative reverse transcriptase domain-containing protein [Tanacetum coccineum]
MKKIFQRLPLGRGGSRGSFEFGVGATKEGKVVCLVFQEWDKEQEEAFLTLKDNLCDTLILSLPDGSKEFVVYCDTSNQGLGCVLMQRGKVIAETLKTSGFIVTTRDTRVEVGDDFITRLPRSSSGYDTNWVIVDRLTKAWSACVDHLKSWRKIYFAIQANIEKGLRDAIGYEYGLSSSNGWAKVEVGDKVMLEVSSWKEVVHFGKKEMLAPRYVGPFKIIKGIGPMVDKTLRFVEEPVEIIEREVKSLKRSRIPIVKSIGTRSEVMRIS